MWNHFVTERTIDLTSNSVKLNEGRRCVATNTPNGKNKRATQRSTTHIKRLRPKKKMYSMNGIVGHDLSDSQMIGIKDKCMSQSRIFFL